MSQTAPPPFFFWSCCFPFFSLLICSLYSIRVYLISPLKSFKDFPLGLKGNMNSIIWPTKLWMITVFISQPFQIFSLLLVIGLLWIPGNFWSLSASDTCCFSLPRVFFPLLAVWRAVSQPLGFSLNVTSSGDLIDYPTQNIPPWYFSLQHSHY